MAKALLSKEELVEKLVDIFYDYGYDGATLSVISEVTGLRRASIYHHFPNGKMEMAEAVLAHSDRWGAEHVRSMLESELPPDEKIRRMCAAIDEVHTRPQQLTLMNVFSYGSARLKFGEQVAQRVQRWLDQIALLLADLDIEKQEAMQRALDAYVQIEGAMVLARSLNDLAVFRAVMKKLPEMLLAGTTQEARRTK
jgi:AcrR family transcriptional regulator